MCSTIMFQYSCGCAERVTFECPFSGTASEPNGDYQLYSRRPCAQRYRRHQRKLYSLKRLTATKATTNKSPSLHSRSAIMPTSEFSRLHIGKQGEVKGNKMPTVKVDETCHDCWQCTLRLKTPTDSDDTVPSTLPGSEDEEMENPGESRVLKEIPVKEFNVSPSVTNPEPMPSAEGSSEEDIYNGWE